jgi:hypothetical protein
MRIPVFILIAISFAPVASAVTSEEMEEYLARQSGRTPHSDNPSRGYDGSISNLCQERWKNDYEMQEYCEKNQYSAKARIGGRSNSLCADRWGNDYEMYEYCMNNQENAARRLGR